MGTILQACSMILPRKTRFEFSADRAIICDKTKRYRFNYWLEVSAENNINIGELITLLDKCMDKVNHEVELTSKSSATTTSSSGMLMQRQ